MSKIISAHPLFNNIPMLFSIFSKIFPQLFFCWFVSIVIIYAKLTSRRVVKFTMFSSCKKLEIFNSIIKLVSVFMMNIFKWFKFSSEKPFINHSMFSYFFGPTERYYPISMDNGSLTISNGFRIFNSTPRGTEPAFFPAFYAYVLFFVINNSTNIAFSKHE